MGGVFKRRILYVVYYGEGMWSGSGYLLSEFMPH